MWPGLETWHLLTAHLGYTSNSGLTSPVPGARTQIEAA